MLWVWESGACPTLTKKDAKYVKVEIQDQALSNWLPASGYSKALPALDWSTGAISANGFPWNVPDIQLVSSVEPGVAGNSSMTIEAINEFAGLDGADVATGDLVVGNWYKNNGYTSVTYNSVAYTDGQRFLVVAGVLTYTTVGTGTVERDYGVYDIVTANIAYNYISYIRISTKSTSGGAYVVQYVGVIDPTATEKEVWKATDPETWMVKITADDPLQLLKKTTAAQWMSAGTGMAAPTTQYGGLLRADYDWTSTYTYLTFNGSLTVDTRTFPPGRYVLDSCFLTKPGQDGDPWIFNVFNTDLLRFIKIVDIFEQINKFLGYESTVNDGGAWSDFHSWQFYYNSADSTSSGGTTLVGVGIDDLWVPSGFWTSPQYYEAYSLFDPWETGPHSWKRCADPLEVLDRICSSFGLTYRTRSNAAGQRYLEVIEIAKFSATKAVTNLDTVLSLLEKPNSFTCDGVEIVSTGSAIGSNEVASNVKRGGGGSSMLKYDTFILSANHSQTNYDFKREAGKGNDYGGALLCNLRPVDTDFMCSVFVLTGGTGTAAVSAYSVCVFQPKDNGAGAASTYNTKPENGEWITGGIAFPKATAADPHYSTYIEAPAMALAHYLYNDASFATDPVGFVRPRGDTVEIVLAENDHDAVEYPPIKLTITVAGKTKTYVITEITPSIADDTTKYIGHTREA
ncbi:MAG: hypothetical protein KJ621_21070 [Proteobacteria bacterium]|nr:hypothetical protein [Pseudomonadota bacterium]